MKIDEACINHNAVRLITSKLSTGCDIELGAEDSEAYLLSSLEYIHGICKMAETMKEVLKA